MNTAYITWEDIPDIVIMGLLRCIPLVGSVGADVFSIAATNRKINELEAKVRTFIDEHWKEDLQRAESYFIRGNDLKNIGKYSEAITEYSMAIHLKYDYSSIAYNNRAYAKTMLEVHASAISDCNKAIKLDPDLPQAYNNRAHAKTMLGDHASTVSDCNKVIKLDPDLPQAYNNRAHAKTMLGDHVSAISDCNKAIKLDPDLPQAYNNRAYTRIQIGQYESAITDCNTAISLKQGFSEAYYNRGRAKCMLGQYDEGIIDFLFTLCIDENIEKAKLDLKAALENVAVRKKRYPLEGTNPNLESVKAAIEKQIYQYEDILKPEAMRLHHEERIGYAEISNRIRIPADIIERWLIEEVVHLHDVHHLSYEQISEVMNRSRSYVGKLYNRSL